MSTMRMLAGGLTLLATLTLTAGCGQQGGNTPRGDTKGNTRPGKEGKGDHTHGVGPHGGTVADWGGGQYHVEFTVDHGKQEATVYILGGDEKTPVPVQAKAGQLLLTINEPSFQVMLKASPQQGEPEGKSSRFVGKHERLGKEQEFAGTISGEVDGTPYSGDFKEEPEASKNNKK